ncbi:hypothetical protein GTP41_20880 [Pseudoduganella sp. DS3]|uniref:Integrase catalytic domain-containing protein n=1 Tax=Pseudoduganella guangdongensis TaxID=2692179 RepID=A0A6N9HLL3_9BURK|nr:Mu transposase C-terminal domain-containing protein [Pseudoduganella guangdongensis]MYN04551.1 hypothetical protein [Pseudoduganella guangdongensis]
MFVIEPGQTLQHGLSMVKVVRVVGTQVVLQNLATLEERFAAADALYDEYIARRLIPVSPTKGASDPILLPYERSSFSMFGTDISEAARRHAFSLFKYITELRSLGYRCLRPTPILKLDFARLKQHLRSESEELVDLTLPTVYKWSCVYDKAQGDYRALIPDYSQRGAPGLGRRIPTETVEAIREVFRDLRQNGKKKIRVFDVMFDVQSQLQSRVPAEQVSLFRPSRSTVERMVKAEFSAYEVCVRNKGLAHAQKKYRSHFPRDAAMRPLEVVEFDDKDTRTFLIDELTNLPMGRAYVTPGVDQFASRCLGMSMSHRQRSTSSALDAFRSCMLPKGPVMRQAGLRLEVDDAFGPPGIAIFDNALYFHASALETAIREAGNSMCAWAKPYTPTEKSVVENFNGELVEYLLSELPGFGGEKKERNQIKDGIETATMGLTQFRNILFHWAYNVHPNKPRENGQTPAQRWASQMRHTRARLPANLDQFDAYFAHSHTVQLRPEGIRFLGLIYQSETLANLRRRLGSNAKVVFRYQSEGSLSRIFVLDPISQKYFTVPSAHPEYTARITLYQHRLIRKMARERMINNPALPDLLRARQELQSLICQSRLSVKRHERIWANNALPDSGRSAPVEKTIELVSEVEYQVGQIAEVVLESTDESWDIPEDF